MNWSEVLTVNSDPSKPLNELIAESSGAIGHKTVKTAFGTATVNTSATTVLQVVGGNNKRLLGVVCFSTGSNITYRLWVKKNGTYSIAYSQRQNGSSKEVAFLTPDYILRSNSTSYIAFIPTIVNASAVTGVAYPTYINTGNVKIAYDGLSGSVANDTVFIMQPIENVEGFYIDAKLDSSSTTAKVYAIYEQD